MIRQTAPLMQNTPDTDSRSPPSSGGVITRAQSGPGNDTAQPSLTSGFGAVIEKEQDLQSATRASVGHAVGHRTTEIDRILHHQHSRLGANIALLEQRYGDLPKPERFATWCDRTRANTKPRRVQLDEARLLPDLIARHTSLLADIEALIGRAPDGQRGELILNEVSRNHEDMAWMLTALLTEDATVARRPEDETKPASSTTSQAEDNWDNEGGPVASRSANTTAGLMPGGSNAE
jgi:hypothetical protein